jgi:hypothetical protein
MAGLTKKQMTSANGLRIGSNASTNIYQGGGDKKAGLQPTTNKGYMFKIAMEVHPTRNTQANYGSPTVIMGLKHTRVPHKALKNVGSTYSPNTYFKIY